MSPKSQLCQQRWRYEILGISKLRTYQPTKSFFEGDTIGKPIKPQYFIPCVELNPPSRIAVLKLPDFFNSQELFTIKFLIIRKKPGFTIVEQAVVLVPDCEKVVRQLADWV